MSWMTWILFVGLLWIYPVWILAGENDHKPHEQLKINCVTPNTTHLVVGDNFNGFLKGSVNGSLSDIWKLTQNDCIVFVHKNATTPKQKKYGKRWPQMEEMNGSLILRISKFYIKNKMRLYVLNGNCNTFSDVRDSTCSYQPLPTATGGACQIRCVNTGTICKQSRYDDNHCRMIDEQTRFKTRQFKNSDRLIINLTATEKNCLNCNNPVKKPEKEITLNVTIETDGEQVDAAQAAEIMNNMANLANSLNGSSAELTLGENITGILLKQTDPLDIEEVSFAYASPKDSINIIDDRDTLAQFSRSVTVSKEAFDQATGQNVTVPFVTLLRFTNLASDEQNSTILGNEVLAVEMGATIMNLTDKMSIKFRNIKYDGNLSCQSWNGEGKRPNWTDDGCLTVTDGENVTCQCSHLTFFAILMTPHGETISSSDLNNLTIITQIGCGLSMFFLSIVLFMHFLLRKSKACNATVILIHLVSAMFLLNFTFLINNYVAEMKSSVGCKIMGALMHYFMLATFTWFAVQAFHLCFQMYMGGKDVIRHYILKVSIISWVLPSIVAIVLLIIGKYGEQVINTSDPKNNVTMCWITDNDVHYVVNIGYYGLVFVFTFSTFIIILHWLCSLNKTKAATADTSRNGKSIVVIMGLCCMLGVTWGFAFFAYGVLRVPSYYIFTILNSFQGFFLFIYYYNSSHLGELVSGVSGHRNSTSTMNSSLHSVYDNNPYNPKETKGN